MKRQRARGRQGVGGMFAMGNMKRRIKYWLPRSCWVSSFGVVDTFTPFDGQGSPTEQEPPPPSCGKTTFELYNTWNLRTRHRRPVENLKSVPSPGPSETNVLAPHGLISLIRLLAPARFRFQTSQTHVVTHEPLRINERSAFHCV